MKTLCVCGTSNFLLTFDDKLTEISYVGSNEK